MNLVRNKETNVVTIDGKKVKFAHFRLIDDRGNVEPRGGATVAYIGEADAIEAAGVSYCSNMDNFVYHYGRHKALGRLAQGIERGLASDEPREAEGFLPVKFVKEWTAEEIESEMNLHGYSRF